MEAVRGHIALMIEMLIKSDVAIHIKFVKSDRKYTLACARRPHMPFVQQFLVLCLAFSREELILLNRGSKSPKRVFEQQNKLQELIYYN